MGISGRLKLVIGLAFVSMIASIAVLFIPSSPEWTLGNRSEVSTAISAIFALLTGIIAVSIVGAVETSDFRAQEQLKADLTSIVASLNGLLMKVTIGRVSADKSVISYAVEKDTINRIISGSTGFALNCWFGKKAQADMLATKTQASEWRCVTGYIAEILSSTELRDGNVPHWQFIGSVLLPLHSLLSGASERDVKQLAEQLGDLTRSMPIYKTAFEENVYLQALGAWVSDEAKKSAASVATKTRANTPPAGGAH